MTTSMQLAQECLKQGPSPGEEQAEVSQPFEGLESFAQTIESGDKTMNFFKRNLYTIFSTIKTFPRVCFYCQGRD